MIFNKEYFLVHLSLCFFLLLLAAHPSVTEDDVGSGNEVYDDYEEGDDEYENEDEEGEFPEISGDGGDEDEDEDEDEDSSEVDYKLSGPCFLEMRKMKSSKISQNKKVDDILTPQCTSTGEFVPQQCHEGVCWCVSGEGMELKGSRHSASDNKQCANFNPDDDVTFDPEYPKKLPSLTGPAKAAFFSSSHPAFLAAIIVMVVMGLAGAVLVVMFIVYRMRKKDEGSYALAHNNNSTAPERRSTRSLIFGGGGVGGKEGGHNQDQHFYSLQQQLQQPLQQEFYA